MKRGYKRLLIFEILLCAVLFINSFVFNFLSGFGNSIFLIIVLILFKCLFGFEKDKHRYIKDIILDTLIFLIIFFLLYYLSGIIIGFAKTNYYSIDGLKRFIFPIVCYVILREYLRYMMMCKSEGSNLLTVVTVMFFIFLDITSSIYYGSFNSNYNIFLFTAATLIPAITSNIVFSYIARKVGYKPIIVWALIMGLYRYVLPIVPNPSQYLVAMIDIVLPVIFGYKVNSFFRKTADEEIQRNYHKMKKKITALIPVAVIVIILVYFISGYFKFWAIAIASGSMEPKIHKGDIVIINKDFDFNDIEKGQVIAYKNGKIIVVHRVVKKEKIKGKYYFLTKGDANKEKDDLIIEEDMIVGVVNHKIAYIGLPTVWLNE